MEFISISWQAISENVPKTSFLKITFFKRFMVWQRFNGFPCWKLLFSKNVGLEYIPAILLKTDSINGIIWHRFCKVPLFNILENFLEDIAVIPFIQEDETLLKMTSLEYIVYRTNFQL